MKPTQPASAKPAPLRPHELYSLPNRIEDALAGSKADLAKLSLALSERVREAIRALPLPVLRVVQDADATSDLHAAYLLGQLSFAQGLVSSVFNRRADDDFMDFVRSSTYAPMLKLLFRGELSNQQLSEQLSESAEGVSRKLRVMREKGVTEFRKNGRVVVNFLTPAGIDGVHHVFGE